MKEPPRNPSFQATYPSADQVGGYVVFNVGGNKYRRHVLAHGDYDRGLRPGGGEMAEARTSAGPELDPGYLELARRFPLRRIAGDGDHAATSALLNGLMDRGPLTPGWRDYFDALGSIVAAYEDEHGPEMGASDPAGVLADLMAERGVNQAQVVIEAGIPKQTLSAILSGRRPSRGVMAKLGDYFHVHPRVFLRRAPRRGFPAAPGPATFPAGGREAALIPALFPVDAPRPGHAHRPRGPVVGPGSPRGLIKTPPRIKFSRAGGGRGP